MSRFRAPRARGSGIVSGDVDLSIYRAREACRPRFHITHGNEGTEREGIMGQESYHLTTRMERGYSATIRRGNW